MEGRGLLHIWRAQSSLAQALVKKGNPMLKIAKRVCTGLLVLGLTWIPSLAFAQFLPCIPGLTCPPPDRTPPTVSITSPASGATVFGTINITADASDNRGVAGVQFQLDGANGGGEDTTAPYSVP